MKKLLAIVFSLVLVFAVAGCKEKNKNDNTNNISSKSSSKSQASSKEDANDEGVKLADGTIIYSEGGISENAKIEIKDENGNVLLNGENIFKVSAKYFPEGTYGIQLEFNESGTEKFKIATEQNLEKTLSIYVDEKLIASPYVSEVINDDKCVITNYEFNKEQIIEIYNNLTK